MKAVDLWQRFKDSKKAVPSFNFTTADVALTAAKVVKKYSHYCLLSTSERELKFNTMEVVVGIVKGLKEQGFPVFLNLDHGRDLEIIKKAAGLGYDCIHFDGSTLPLGENIRITKEVVGLCRPHGISVEGEVGQIGGSSTVSDETTGASILTNVDEAIRFVKETGVNLLACSFGSFHGMVEGKTKVLDTAILEEIKKQVVVPFVLHGGSGIDNNEIRRAVDAGVVKINFNTELRLAWSAGIKEYQKEKPEDIIPANELAHADQKVEEVIEAKVKICLGINV
jgi:tagatose 1,6-diphosphate aldolase GatY/KbaY